MMSKKPTNAVHKEIIEPDTTLHNEGKIIHITTKLPGINEEKIRIEIDLEKTTITIVATNTSKIFKKVINLPGNVIFNKKLFSDGELHLIVEKKES